MQITTEQLFQIIGELFTQIRIKDAQIAQLQAELKEKDEED
jgi:hypothetical protein